MDEHVAAGGVTLGGSADAEITVSFYEYTASGGLSISGGVGDVPHPIHFETVFRWGATQGPYHYYRVLSDCMPRTCPPLSDDDECLQGSQHNVTVFARSVQEVCQKLTQRGYTFPVNSVVRFDPPARYSDWSSSDDPECREMVDVTDDFFEVVDCVSLTIDADLDINQPLQMEVEDVELNEFSYTPSGGPVIGGSSDVDVTWNESSWWEHLPSGGLVLGGGISSVGSSHWHYVASGGLTLSGPELEYFHGYEASGQLVLGGHADSIIVGTEDLDVKAENEVTAEVEAVYASIDADELEGSSDEDAATLCCPTSTTPLLMYLGHNLNRAQNLAQFLLYNNLTMLQYSKIVYRENDEIWQGNHYYRGQSIAGDGTVIWNITFEFGCINPSFGPTDLSATADYWKFGLWANMKNLTTSYDAQTRLLLFFHKDVVCQSSFPVSNFGFQFNTATLLSNPVTSLSPVLYDGAGLFKSHSWTNNPVLEMNIQSGPIEEQDYVVYPELKTPIGEVRGGSSSGFS